ncbi:cisplatin damage response ATP-dependent DNA ligase [Minwuia thermotolerans]|uniref:DNA ligase (ATP) n=1 Tax=Minwuia thermotolerans TaxID=2056226 RepID=A0A2M9G4A4_9PROT|nr:cisplatin damage response ATP-dependent DNA ligase [Minwuia thermotolerans]PJK30528.1 ATP-dependent DNA ligase [Minwuia thermotolerans]
MEAFAELLDRLSHVGARNVKVRLIADYMRRTPDPDRGVALAALAGELSLKTVKPALVRELAGARTDPELFRLSYDYVGDLAETVALLWPAPETPANAAPGLAETVERLEAAARKDAPALVAELLDRLDANGRWALLKLITGGLRVGVSARLARTALAELGAPGIDEIEEVWHALAPPYGPLFDWIEGRAPKPDLSEAVVFRPLMLSHALDDAERPRLDPADFRAEWKWDGIRVQLALHGGERRLFSRTGDDISAAFPDLLESLEGEGVLDGELLVMREGALGRFNDLQQRLNRKTVTKKLLADFPAGVRLYDILFDGAEDLRGLGFDDRRTRLEAWARARPHPRLDLSPLVPFRDLDELESRRMDPPHPAIEGVMLKRADSPYRAGRPKGLWYKWKRDPMTVDCVLLYAQRGHGKRSSLHSDFTFGVWRGGEAGPELVPVGKAYFGFTDAELAELDRFVRNHTVDRYGPVRAVEAKLVLEIAFDGIHRSKRHKSGVAMRFPRIARIRWDKPAAEADRLETLEALIGE